MSAAIIAFKPKPKPAAPAAIEYLDRPPLGWFVLDVLRENARGWNWAALMIDIDPDDFRAGRRASPGCWVRIAGKHKSRDAAWEALEDAMATRH